MTFVSCPSAAVVSRTIRPFMTPDPLEGSVPANVWAALTDGNTANLPTMFMCARSLMVSMVRPPDACFVSTRDRLRLMQALNARTLSVFPSPTNATTATMTIETTTTAVISPAIRVAVRRSTAGIIQPSKAGVNPAYRFGRELRWSTLKTPGSRRLTGRPIGWTSVRGRSCAGRGSLTRGQRTLLRLMLPRRGSPPGVARCRVAL
jgi:hypothetical protein